MAYTALIRGAKAATTEGQENHQETTRGESNKYNHVIMKEGNGWNSQNDGIPLLRIIS
jgi:hypothetical protein